MENMLKFGLLWMMALQMCMSLLKPTEFDAVVRQALPEGVKMIAMDLGRSLNGYTIMAYGITAIPSMPDQPDPNTLKPFPSSLLTSYIHPRDQHTVQLAVLSVQFLLDKYNSDFYTRAMLLRSIVWIIPYINIDAYEHFMQKNIDQQSQRALYAKNRNMNPDPYGHLNDQCTETHTLGVNLDNNFWFAYSRPQDICEQFYGGYDVFSQPETQALKTFITSFNIRVIIDLQAFGDYWVYPNHIHQIIASPQPLSGISGLYQDLIYKLAHGGYKIGSNQQMRTDVKGGGFIQWASNITSHSSSKGSVESRQGVIALTCMFGQSFILNQNQLEDSANKAIQVIEMLLLKNNPLYEKYTNKGKTKLFFKAVGVMPFSLTIKIENPATKQTFQKQYRLKVGQLLTIDLPVSSQKGSQKQSLKLELKVDGTGIEEQVLLNQLKDYLEAWERMKSYFPVNSRKQQQKSGANKGDLSYMGWGMLAIVVLGLIACRGQGNGYQKVDGKARQI